MVKRSFLLGFCISLLILVSTVVQAQEVKIEAPKSVGVGEQFNIVYEVRDAEIQDVKDFKLPSSLNLLYGPASSVSSSTQSINGRLSSSMRSSITYTLVATSKGQVNIPPLSVRVGGKWVATHPISIAVIGSSRKTNTIQNQVQSSTRQGKYFYRVIPSKTSVYEQEYLSVSYRLYGTDGFQIQDRESLAYEGFLNHSLRPTDQKIQTQTETYKGELYMTVDMSHDALFAQHSGKLTLPSNKLVLLIPNMDGYNPFMSDYSERTVRSEAVTIDVKPLPQVGKPTNFSGAVGNYTLSLTPSGEMKTGEVITLRIQIKGVGNLKTIKVPQIQLPESFEIYPTQDNYEPIMEGHPYAIRTIDYPVVARNEGEYTIPAISFSFFDPQRAEYKSVIAPAVKLKIAKGKERVVDNGLVIGSNYSSRLMPLKLIPEKHSLGVMSFFLSLPFFFIYLFVIGISYVVYYLLRRNKLLRADVVSFRESRAKLYATRKLKRAKDFAEIGEREKFYNELLQTLWGYMTDKFRLSQSDLTRDKVVDILKERNTNAELIQAWIALIDKVEFERFAPVSLAVNLDEVYNQALELIMSIENNKN